MDVPASPAVWPEWQALLSAFQVRCRRPEGREALERSTTGLLTERPTKHGETIAQAVPGTSAQRLQACLTKMPWDEEDLNRKRVAKRVAAATRGDGVLIVDKTGFATQGTASVQSRAAVCGHAEPGGPRPGGGDLL
jgi:SRSO17 transposase